MPDRPRNVGASVRQRLLNLAHARSQPMELLLTRYALERLLHRLGLSPPDTFDLLGFTHCCGKTRAGKFMVLRSN